MYSWGDAMDDWARPGAYRFDSARAAARACDAARAARVGGRSYEVEGPDMARVDPRKHLHTESRNPLVVAVDVTGSMAHWPFEIFDRLRAAVPLWPAGAAWPAGLAERLAGDLRSPDLGGCDVAAGGGTGRCALVLADLLPQTPGPEAVFLNAAEFFRADGVQVLRRLDSGDWVRGGQILLGDTEVPSEADKESLTVTEMIASLRAGGVKTAPVTLQVLRLGRWQIGMTP